MSQPNTVQFLEEGFQIVNYDWKYVFLNDVAIKQSGKYREKLIGFEMFTIFPSMADSPIFDLLKECMKNRKPSRFENRFPNENGSFSWFDIRLQPCDEGICIFSVDISDRKENENKLKKANSLYALLTNISQKIITVKDEKELFHDCCHFALRFGNFSMAWIGLFDSKLETLTMVDQSGIPAADLPLFDEALKKTNDQLRYIVQSGNYYISTDIQNEPGLEPWKLYAQKHAIKSCILLPLSRSGNIVGLLNLYSAESDFSDDDIKLLQQLTTNISQALDIFQKLEQQHQNQALLLAKEQRYRHTLDNMIEGAQIHDFDWRYTYVNDALVKYSTYKKEQLLGYTLMEKYPGIEHTPLFETLSRCMNDRIAAHLNTEFVFPDGSTAHLELSIQPVPEGIFILSVDRTDQLKATAKLTKANRLYAFNSAINQSIVQIKEERTLMESTCRIAVEIGKFVLAWINTIENDTMKRVCISGTAEAVAAASAYDNLIVNDIIFHDTPTGNVFRTGRYAVSNDIMIDPAIKKWKPRLLTCGIHSSISLPIKKFGVTVGVFELHAGIKDFFDEEEIALLQEATDDISYALENFEKEKILAQAEEQIQKNEKRFKVLIEKSADIKTLATKEGLIIYGSPSYTKILGYSPDEFLNTSLYDLIHPDDLDAFFISRNIIREKAGGTFDFQQRRKHKDGHWLWFEGSVTNMLHEPGINAVVSNFRDITQKKLSEQQRDFDNRNLNALINNTNDLLWSVDLNINLITSNKPFDQLTKEIHGTSLCKGDYVLNGINAERAERFLTYYQRAFNAEIFTVIERSERPTEFWLEISFYPIQIDDKIIGTACHSRDITERIKSEHLLRKSEVFNRGILDSLSAHIAVIKENGEIITVNESWKKYVRENGDSRLKYTCESSNYFKAFDNAMKNGDAEAGKVLVQIKKVLAGQVSDFYYEYPCHYKRQQRWFSMLVRKFENDETLIVISHQDITPRKLVENQLLLNNASLQKTNHELDRFVYSVSHDLRSPLTSMLGLANLIETESNEPDTLLHIGMIRSSISRLDNFIRNILHYSRNNRTDVANEYIAVKDTVYEIIALFNGPKEYEDIAFEVSISDEIPFYSDKYRFATILENLISNAIKYHKKEKDGRFIRIKGKSHKNALELEIEDNGSGIARIYHSKIFDMFFRIGNTINGSGIGLYIVRESIEKLDGTITLTSDGKTGTKFNITLKNSQP